MPDTPHVTELYAAAVQAQQAEDYERAQVLLRQVLAVAPDHAEALNSLGLIAYRAHCYPEAVGLIGQALSLAPGRPAFCNNMGAVLCAWGRRRNAVDYFGRAISGAPADVSFHCNLANALKECGDFEAALDKFRAAIGVDPRYAEAHFGAALCLLALGRVEEAWPEHRWRSMSSGAQFPEAAGALYESLRGRPGDIPADVRGKRLLVLGEQGIGDQLFFLRYAPGLKSLGARLVYFIPETRLTTLLQRCGVLAKSSFIDPARAPQVDHVLLVGDLPLAAKAAIAGTPAPLTIRPEPAALAAIKQRLARAGPPPYLGVTWRAGLPVDIGRPEGLRKAIPLDALGRTVAKWPGTVVALQRQPAQGEIEAFATASGRATHDCSDLHEDLVGMHALLALIDEYVGVSNTNMHLRAGAGRPARVLVAFPPEWRWLARGDASPWFPGFRLYREEEHEGWQPALTRLAADLENRA